MAIALLGALPAGAAVWGRSVESSGVVYLPRYYEGGTVLRYDVAQRAWLPELRLPSATRAIEVEDGTLFYGRGPEISALDLSSGGVRGLATLDGEVRDLAVDGALLFVATSAGLRVVDAETGALLAASGGRWKALVLSAPTHRVYATDGDNLTVIPYGTDGSLGAPLVAWIATNNNDPQIWVDPEGARVYDGSGNVWNAEHLGWENHLQGGVAVIAFDGASPFALRGVLLSCFDEDLIETGRVNPVTTGRQMHLTLDDGELLIFEEGFGSQQEVAPPAIIPLASIRPPGGSPLRTPPRFTNPEEVILDEQGTLYLRDRHQPHVFRWSVEFRSFLDSIRLPDEPLEMAYAPATRRLYLRYQWGRGSTLRYVALDDPQPRERHLLNLQDWILSFAAVGPHVVISTGDRLVSLGSDGRVLDEAPIRTAWGLIWNTPHGRLLYVLGGDAIGAIAIDASGNFGDPLVGPRGPSGSETGPLRLSPDGSRLLTGGGGVRDAVTLTVLGSEISHRDAEWTEFGLFVLRGSDRFRTYLDRLDEDLAVTSSARSSGTEQALAGNGRRLVLVRRAPDLLFSVYPDDDPDGDGIADALDAFPADSAEWQDTDGDGIGDNADLFPEDPSETRDFDGDGVGDRSDPFPIGEPFLGVALQGRQRLSVVGLGSDDLTFRGNLGLLADGSFSFCDRGLCFVGTQTRVDGSRDRFALVPDPTFMTAVAGELEAALAGAFPGAVQAALSFRPETLRFELKVGRGGRTRVHFRIGYTATLEGAPKRFRRVRGSWSWKFEPAEVLVPAP